MAYDTTLTVALTTQASILNYIDTLKQGGKAPGMGYWDVLRQWVIDSGITSMKFSPLADWDANVDQSQDAISNGATTVYGVYYDNNANTGTTYVKMTNATAPTVGVTVPDIELMIPGTTTGAVTGEGAYALGRYLHVFVPGVRFATNLSSHAVTTAGTAGSTDPTNNGNGMIIHT